MDTKGVVEFFECPRTRPARLRCGFSSRVDASSDFL